MTASQQVWHGGMVMKIVCWAILLLPVLHAFAEDADPMAGKGAAPQGMTIIPVEGFNLKVLEHIAPNYVVVAVNSLAHNWFAAKITNVPTDGQVTIGFSMEGNDAGGNPADVTKWVGLTPVMTYADPEKYESYEWFQKDDQGRWTSGDLFKTGDDRYAGTGKTTQQSVIPEEVADEFLSKDGRYWQPWRDVDATETMTNLNIFRIKLHCKLPIVSVAMRAPYTYMYQQALLKKLTEHPIAGISIDDIGTSLGGKEIRAIRVEDPSCVTHLNISQRADDGNTEITHRFQVIEEDTAGHADPREKMVVVIYAREHGTEHDSSWTVNGILRSLIDRLRERTESFDKRIIWVLIPIIDVDAASASIHEGVADWGFYYSTEPGMPENPEIAYVAYLRAFANAHTPILLAASIHNCECREYPVALSPFYQTHEADEQRWVLYGSWCQADDLSDNHRDTVYFNSLYFQRLRALHLPVGSDEPLAGAKNMICRLGGNCYKLFNTLFLTYEVNSRYPGHTRSIAEMEELGGHLVDTIHEYITTDHGSQRLTRAKEFLHKRDQQMSLYWEQQDHAVTDPTWQELIEKGL